MNTDDIGQQQVDRLPQHRRFGLDAAHAPPHHAEAIDHRGMRVGADQRIGIQHAVFLDDVAGQEFEIHLVADAEPRRDDPQAVKRLSAPLQEAIARGIALELHVGVEAQRIGTAKVVDLHGVIDHQVHGHRRLHALDVAAAPSHRRPHRREIDEQRHAGEVLQEHAADHEWDLRGARRLRLPGQEPFDVLVANAPAVAVAQHRFKKDAKAHRQP
jgi:hypothetical protein